jgi:undecaprenyl pyrophosphate synthase
MGQHKQSLAERIKRRAYFTPYVREWRKKRRLPPHWSALQQANRDASRKKRYEVFMPDKVCAHCGTKDRRVLQWAHRRGQKKVFNVANAYIKLGWKRVSAEIKKCVLLCANCHLIYD